MVAAESLELFSKVVPYAGVALCAWDPFAKSHRMISQIGYPNEVERYLTDGYFRFDQAYSQMRRGEAKFRRWREMPASYEDTYSVQAVFRPAGYCEGISAYLVTPDGRYTGAFHLSSDSIEHPSDQAATVIDWLRPVFANICDQMRSAVGIASSIPAGAAAIVISNTEELIPIPGRKAGPWLREGSGLIRLARITARRSGSSFLWRDPEGDWHRVQSVPVTGGLILSEEPCQVLPYSLTPRELEVLTLVARGGSNAEIAANLVITDRTVATHVEHLLEKLDCRNRATCAAKAVEEGLILSNSP